ncbi:MAG: Maf-like protein [Muribaculaceae bacterium]
MNPLKNLDKYEVILASTSPRRKQLLAEVGVMFKVMALPDVDESYPDTISTELIASYISRKKANAYSSIITPTQLLITADTIVVNDGIVLGKPKDTNAAREMIKSLSGKTHKVITGVTIKSKDKITTFDATTEVEFAELSDEEIDYYIDKFSPFDKAGAYGIQEWIGCIGVKRIAGSYYNVMGMPLHRLYTELKTF